jgi:hypothetical protein
MKCKSARKSKNSKIMCYTDYPLYLAAIPFEDWVNKNVPPPVGEPEVYDVELISYDGDKYAVVYHEKYKFVEFKAGYLKKKKDLSDSGFSRIELESIVGEKHPNAIGI